VPPPIGPEQQRLTPVERANLVAYLDGELAEPESRAIATKLTNSVTARKEVESLERTWELLEYLPRPKASESLAERTLTEVRRIDAGGGRFEAGVAQVTQRVIRTALWVGGAAAAFLLGMVLTQWVWPSPTERLARDLSIAEHLDEYRDVGTFEFLEHLANSPEFGTDRDEAR